MSKLTIIITGSNGFVGSAFVSYFLNKQFLVRRFQRKPPDDLSSNVEYYPLHLADVRDTGFQGAQYLIHCAYRPIVNKEERESGVCVDVEATKKIISLSRKYGIKIIFLSTLSAHPEAESYYARHKFIAEGLFDLQKDLIIKIGIVLGNGGGLFGRLVDNIKNHNIIPLIGGGRQRTQVIAIDDLCRVIENGIMQNTVGCYKVSHPQSVTTGELYQDIAEYVGVKSLFLPVPLHMVYYVVLAAERMGIRLPFTAENILGLKDLRAYDTATDVQVLGVPLKNLQESFSWLKKTS